MVLSLLNHISEFKEIEYKHSLRQGAWVPESIFLPSRDPFIGKPSPHVHSVFPFLAIVHCVFLSEGIEWRRDIKVWV